MAKYGRKASKEVERAMHERKAGTLRSGSTGERVTSRKQAIAIGLSEARREGAKVPGKRTGKNAGKPSVKKAGKKAGKKSASKRTAGKR